MVSDPKLRRRFVCPLCASNEYVYVIFVRNNGSYYRTDFFQCAGCTVAFTDPDRFSRLMCSIYDPERAWRQQRPTKDFPPTDETGC